MPCTPILVLDAMINQEANKGGLSERERVSDGKICWVLTE